jgi:hypothetical protein
MKTNHLLALLVLGAGSLMPCLRADITASEQALLNDAEVRRGVRFSSGMQWTVAAGSKSSGTDANATLIVRSQAGKAAAEVVSPPSSAGKKYLLTDGQMYFYRPGTKRAVPVPRRQQVAGDAAIGDIASISFLQEYSPAAATKATLDGEACTKFELRARPGTSASYDRIELWISNDQRVSRKAEFFTRTGKHIRTATFEHKASITVSGKTLPFLSKLVVVEMLGTPKTTVLSFKDYKTRNFPAETFEVEHLPAPS